jgi:hypothetical protein
MEFGPILMTEKVTDCPPVILFDIYKGENRCGSSGRTGIGFSEGQTRCCPFPQVPELGALAPTEMPGGGVWICLVDSGQWEGPATIPQRSS